MASKIRVIYGTEVDTEVDGSLSPQVIFDTLKATYKELADGTFTITTQGDTDVMRITLKEGRKA